MSTASGILARTAAALLFFGCVSPHAVRAKAKATPLANQSAAETMLALGPEGQALAKRAGDWDVTFTSWSKPGASPVTTEGLIAEREMIGPMLQERLHPLSGSSGTPWSRIDDLTYNRIDGRWDYMSMDTRAPVGLMPAYSLGRDPVDRIVLSFIPFAIPGESSIVSGQMLRMEQIIRTVDDDHEVKDQYFLPADGLATRWLAKRYSYARKRSREITKGSLGSTDVSRPKTPSR